jgi:NAD(P)-dependent dehydrogenase (short-subunit alcohol dehydrogenase family)
MAVTRHLVPIAAVTSNEWEAERAANLSAPSRAIRLRLPGMRARGRGRILDISPIHGLFASAGRLGQVNARTALIRRMRAFVRPEVVAAMVVFLCSPAGDDATEATLPTAGD